MRQLIIFDMDGVLCDCRELHYESLNKALTSIHPKYAIARDEHLATYDGLSTNTKLQMLTKSKGLPVALHNEIWQRKQDITIALVKQFATDTRLANVLRQLKVDGHTIAVASNAIRETVKLILLKKGLLEHIDFFFSNQDVHQTKPNPEIYLRCMIKAGVGPRDTIVVEDSDIGKQGAISSGAFLVAVNSSMDVDYQAIKVAVMSS